MNGLEDLMRWDMKTGRLNKNFLLSQRVMMRWAFEFGSINWTFQVVVVFCKGRQIM